VTNDTLANALNRDCHCISVDRRALQESLETRLGGSEAYLRLRETHPHLLADSPVFISREHVGQMTAVIDAIEHVVSLEPYQDLALGWAPDIARQPLGPHGVFYGYDFHLTNDGPKLIEVNTNAGGALLLLHLAGAQQACCEEVEDFIVGGFDVADIERTFVEMFRKELQTQSAAKTLRCIAIVDENPDTQYLSPEFLLFKEMFAHHDIEAVITGPEEFKLHGGILTVHDKTVDLVYNRLTDFYLQSNSCAVLKRAYETRAAVFTPSPHMHALYANKRNLMTFSDPVLLGELGVDDNSTATLLASIPKTELVTADNAAGLWSRRKHLFFKPIWGFGSRGTYKGAKLTKKTWASIIEADYIAQELVTPSERLVIVDGNHQSLKLDVRCYVYNGQVQLLGARLYRGQTTNFRTDGGGLAAVFIAPGA
jgi:hypothetical protein